MGKSFKSSYEKKLIPWTTLSLSVVALSQPRSLDRTFRDTQRLMHSEHNLLTDAQEPVLDVVDLFMVEVARDAPHTIKPVTTVARWGTSVKFVDKSNLALTLDKTWMSLKQKL